MTVLPVSRRRAHIAALAGLGALGAALLPQPALADVQASREAYQRALTEFQGGDLRSARIELLTALKENKDNALARILFARVLLARGNGVQAQTEIERAIASGFPREKTHHLIANSLLLQGEYSRALDSAIASRVPPQFGAYAARMRGRAYMGLQNKDAAGREFALATRLAPDSPDAWVDLARYQAGQKQLGQTSVAIERALAANPNHVPALLLKAGFLRATQGLSQAVPLYGKVLDIDSNNIEALLERAATYGDLNQNKLAQADIDRVKGLIPGHPMALYLESVMLARAGEYQKAQDALVQTKGVLGGFPPAQMLQGMLSMQLGNPAQAQEAFGKMVAESPDNLAARRMLAYAQLRNKDAQGAVSTLAPLTRQDPAKLDAATLGLMGTAFSQAGRMTEGQKYFELASKVAPNKSAFQTQLAMTKLAQGDVSGAEMGLGEALKADPNSLQALMSLALIKLRERNFAAAATAADRIVQAHPEVAAGYNIRGVANLGRRNLKDAEADFRNAIAKDPKFLDARRNLAQMLMNNNRRAEGEKVLQEALGVNPKDVPSLMLLAQSAAQRNATDESIDYLKRASLAVPNAYEPRAALVQTYVNSRRQQDALTEAVALAQARPDDVRAIRMLAAVHFAAKRPKDAVTALESFATRRPNDPVAAVMLADGYAAGGRPEDARRTMENALRLPNAPADAIYLNLVRLETGLRNYNGALAWAEKLKAVTKSPLAADKLIGDINMAANRPDAAIAAYQRVAAGSKTAQGAGLVASAQVRAGRPKDAIATLTAYRRANPTDLLGGVLLGDVYVSLGDWKNAIATYESMGNTPAMNSPVVLNNLAWAYSQVNDKRAVPVAAEAYKRAPNAPEIADTYGWILVSTGSNPKQGLAILQNAAKAAPNNPTVRYHLGMAYRANGMAADARRELSAVANANAGGLSQQARTALASLR